MDNVQALKNLYVQLGGDPADVADISTNADMINAIAGLDIGGGGGSTDFVITVTRASEAWAIDKTVDEVLAAYDAGNNITIIVNYNNDVYVLRDFQEGRKILSYDNELSLAAILPDRRDAADNVNNYSVSTFVLNAAIVPGEGKDISACIYKSAYTISDDGTVTGTKTEVR